MKFESLHLQKEIIEALHKLNYKACTDVQEQVIPKMLKGKDVIVKAKTGSGKTAAFAIPLIENIQWEENKPQALVLTPTRELALQIKEDFDNIGVYRRIKTLAVFGKQPYKFQTQDLKQKTHVVVGTPGRVLDHLGRETLDVSKLRYLIIDEADEMFNMGFIDTVREIIDSLPQERVTCLFSATMPEVIQDLVQDYMKDYEVVEVEQPQVVNEQVDAMAYEVRENEKPDFLLKLLVHEQVSSAIIFCKTQEHVNDVCELLYKEGCSVDKIHGGMMQEDRIENMNDFRMGKIQFLVATDVAARGIDVENITHVINYDMPLEAQGYVHRIGRTARIGKSGRAITFISQFDDERKEMIENFINAPFQILDKQMIQATVVDQKAIYDLSKLVVRKEKKNKEIQKDITKLYLNGGKQKKIRPGDLVGAICEIQGVSGDDIGVIQVQDICSYVDILHGKGKMVLNALRKTTIKGKKLKVEISKGKD